MNTPIIDNKNVLIIGCPASGKTTLSSLYDSKSHNIIHTDDYIKHGFKESMYKCLDDIINSEKPTIVEGVQGYRLLRKGVELNNYFPDIVIELRISEKKMLEIYSKERDSKKVKYLKGFLKANNKVLSDYKSMPNNSKPEWIVIDNDY